MGALNGKQNPGKKIILQEIGGKERFQELNIDKNADYRNTLKEIRTLIPQNRHYRFYDNPYLKGVHLEKKRFPNRRVIQDGSTIYVVKLPVERKFEAWQGARFVPVSGITHYSKIVLRRRNGILVVHNIGEIHERNSECLVKMQKRLSAIQLIKNTISQDFPVHVFVEREFGQHPALHSGEKRQGFNARTSNLNKIEKLLDPCFSYYQRFLQKHGKEVECQFPKAIVHYTDLRINYFKLRAKMSPEDFYRKKKGIFKDYFKLVENQIKSISDERERNFMYRLIEDSKKIMKGEESLYHKKEVFDPRELFDFGILQAWILDLNMIARILRDYDEQPVRHAIIYSGDLHSKVYDKFFKDLGADIVKSPKTTRKIEGSDFNFPVQCIPIPLVISEKWPDRVTPVLDFSEELVGEYSGANQNYLLYSQLAIGASDDPRIQAKSLPEVANRKKKRHISDRTMRNEMRNFRKWGAGDFGTSR